MRGRHEVQEARKREKIKYRGRREAQQAEVTPSISSPIDEPSPFAKAAMEPTKPECDHRLQAVAETQELADARKRQRVIITLVSKIENSVACRNPLNERYTQVRRHIS